MSIGIRSRWRQAIGWIAAYALALQAIVGGLDLIQTASASGFDPSAIICTHNGAVDDGTADQAPGDTGHSSHTCGHCALCSQLAAPPLAPRAQARVRLEPISTVLAGPHAIAIASADIASRPGKPRAPPAGA